MKSIVLHDSEFIKISNFNIVAGSIFPVYSHKLDGQVSILVLEGERAFLADKKETIPANSGDILDADIREPHGVR